MEIDYKQMEFIDQLLRIIVGELEYEYGSRVVTSLFRIGDTGVHGTLPLRGIDLREQTETIGEEMRDWLNERWIYDPERPSWEVCKYHDTGQGIHLHVQVHRNTMRR